MVGGGELHISGVPLEGWGTEERVMSRRGRIVKVGPAVEVEAREGEPRDPDESWLPTLSSPRSVTWSWVNLTDGGAVLLVKTSDSDGRVLDEGPSGGVVVREVGLRGTDSEWLRTRSSSRAVSWSVCSKI